MTTKSLIQTICETADIEFRSYSGRGMFGRQCLGITAKDALTVAVDLFDGLRYAPLDEADLDAAHEDLAQALREARTDSMGMDVIVYFPDIAVVESEVA